VSRGHEPQRTCVGCRNTGRTDGMIRVVRTSEGVVVTDPSGRSQGRGAWVHARLACVEAALARGGLARALRAGVGAEAAGRLRELSNHGEQEQA